MKQSVSEYPQFGANMLYNSPKKRHFGKSQIFLHFSEQELSEDFESVHF